MVALMVAIITLCIIVSYIAIGIVLTRILIVVTRTAWDIAWNDDDNVAIGLTVLIWPVVLPAALFLLLVHSIGSLAKGKK